MKRILVATDFSTRSDRALRRAVLVARRAEASLILVHVVDGDRSERLVASERREALSLLAEAADTLSSSDGIEAEPMVVVDDVHSGILDAADRSGAGLIVLGPHRPEPGTFSSARSSTGWSGEAGFRCSSPCSRPFLPTSGHCSPWTSMRLRNRRARPR